MARSRQPVPETAAHFRQNSTRSQPALPTAGLFFCLAALLEPTGRPGPGLEAGIVIAGCYPPPLPGCPSIGIVIWAAFCGATLLTYKLLAVISLTPVLFSYKSYFLPSFNNHIRIFKYNVVAVFFG